MAFFWAAAERNSIRVGWRVVGKEEARGQKAMWEVESQQRTEAYVVKEA